MPKLRKKVNKHLEDLTTLEEMRDSIKNIKFASNKKFIEDTRANLKTIAGEIPVEDPEYKDTDEKVLRVQRIEDQIKVETKHVARLKKEFDPDSTKYHKKPSSGKLTAIQVEQYILTLADLETQFLTLPTVPNQDLNSTEMGIRANITAAITEAKKAAHNLKEERTTDNRTPLLKQKDIIQVNLAKLDWLDIQKTNLEDMKKNADKRLILLGAAPVDAEHAVQDKWAREKLDIENEELRIKQAIGSFNKTKLLIQSSQSNPQEFINAVKDTKNAIDNIINRNEELEMQRVEEDLQKLKDVEAEIVVMQNKIQQLKDQIPKLNALLAELRAKVEKLGEETPEFIKSVKDVNTNITELENTFTLAGQMPEQPGEELLSLNEKYKKIELLFTEITQKLNVNLQKVQEYEHTKSTAPKKPDDPIRAQIAPLTQAVETVVAKIDVPLALYESQKYESVKLDHPDLGSVLTAQKKELNAKSADLKNDINSTSEQVAQKIKFLNDLLQTATANFKQISELLKQHDKHQAELAKVENAIKQHSFFDDLHDFVIASEKNPNIDVLQNLLKEIYSSDSFILKKTDVDSLVSVAKKRRLELAQQYTKAAVDAEINSKNLQDLAKVNVLLPLGNRIPALKGITQSENMIDILAKEDAGFINRMAVTAQNIIGGKKDVNEAMDIALNAIKECGVARLKALSTIGLEQRFILELKDEMQTFLIRNKRVDLEKINKINEATPESLEILKNAAQARLHTLEVGAVNNVIHAVKLCNDQALLRNLVNKDLKANSDKLKSILTPSFQDPAPDNIIQIITTASPSLNLKDINEAVKNKLSELAYARIQMFIQKADGTKLRTFLANPIAKTLVDIGCDRKDVDDLLVLPNQKLITAVKDRLGEVFTFPDVLNAISNCPDPAKLTKLKNAYDELSKDQFNQSKEQIANTALTSILDHKLWQELRDTNFPISYDRILRAAEEGLQRAEQLKSLSVLEETLRTPGARTREDFVDLINPLLIQVSGRHAPLPANDPRSKQLVRLRNAISPLSGSPDPTVQNINDAIQPLFPNVSLQRVPESRPQLLPNAAAVQKVIDFLTNEVFLENLQAVIEAPNKTFRQTLISKLNLNYDHDTAPHFIEAEIQQIKIAANASSMPAAAMRQIIDVISRLSSERLNIINNPIQALPQGQIKYAALKAALKQGFPNIQNLKLSDDVDFSPQQIDSIKRAVQQRLNVLAQPNGANLDSVLAQIRNYNPAQLNAIIAASINKPFSVAALNNAVSVIQLSITFPANINPNEINILTNAAAIEAVKQGIRDNLNRQELLQISNAADEGALIAVLKQAPDKFHLQNLNIDNISFFSGDVGTIRQAAMRQRNQISPFVGTDIKAKWTTLLNHLSGSIAVRPAIDQLTILIAEPSLANETQLKTDLAKLQTALTRVPPQKQDINTVIAAINANIPTADHLPTAIRLPTLMPLPQHLSLSKEEHLQLDVLQDALNTPQNLTSIYNALKPININPNHPLADFITPLKNNIITRFKENKHGVRFTPEDTQAENAETEQLISAAVGEIPKYILTPEQQTQLTDLHRDLTAIRDTPLSPAQLNDLQLQVSKLNTDINPNHALYQPLSNLRNVLIGNPNPDAVTRAINSALTHTGSHMVPTIPPVQTPAMLPGTTNLKTEQIAILRNLQRMFVDELKLGNPAGAIITAASVNRILDHIEPLLTGDKKTKLDANHPWFGELKALKTNLESLRVSPKIPVPSPSDPAYITYTNWQNRVASALSQFEPQLRIFKTPDNHQTFLSDSERKPLNIRFNALNDAFKNISFSMLFQKHSTFHTSIKTLADGLHDILQSPPKGLSDEHELRDPLRELYNEILKNQTPGTRNINYPDNKAAIEDKFNKAKLALANFRKGVNEITNSTLQHNDAGELIAGPLLANYLGLSKILKANAEIAAGSVSGQDHQQQELDEIANQSRQMLEVLDLAHANLLEKKTANPAESTKIDEKIEYIEKCRRNLSIAIWNRPQEWQKKKVNFFGDEAVVLSNPTGEALQRQIDVFRGVRSKPSQNQGAAGAIALEDAPPTVSRDGRRAGIKKSVVFEGKDIRVERIKIKHFATPPTTPERESQVVTALGNHEGVYKQRIFHDTPLTNVSDEELAKMATKMVCSFLAGLSDTSKRMKLIDNMDPKLAEAIVTFCQIAKLQPPIIESQIKSGMKPLPDIYKKNFAQTLYDNREEIFGTEAAAAGWKRDIIDNINKSVKTAEGFSPRPGRNH